jgi:hypothetical protein
MSQYVSNTKILPGERYAGQKIVMDLNGMSLCITALASMESTTTVEAIAFCVLFLIKHNSLSV